jgi:hypothetical protein
MQLQRVGLTRNQPVQESNRRSQEESLVRNPPPSRYDGSYTSEHKSLEAESVVGSGKEV